MGRFSGVLLAADYDDTLYSKTLSISRKNREAIERFMAEGGLFCVCTGRSYVNFSIQMEQEKVPVNTPVILSNGAAIYDYSARKMLWARALPDDTILADLRHLCGRFPELGLEAYNGDDIFVYRANESTERHLKKCRLTGIPCELEAIPMPLEKVMLQHMDMAYLEEARKYAAEAWPNRYEVTFSNHTLLEMTASGAHKGSAVQRMARYLGISPEHVYCVGNGLNDIPMLEVSAVPYAPSNSYIEVHQFGATILPSCDEDCVAHLIGILEERYPARES